MNKKRKINPRYAVLAIILIAVMLIFSLRLAQYQLIDANKILDQADTSGVRTATIKAARGEILDRYGRPIAVNKEAYNIVFNSAYLPKDNINSTIKTLVALLQEKGLEWVDTLPLTQTEPFEYDSSQMQINALISRLGLAHYATAQNCFDQMVKRYYLEGLDTQLQRIIMGVRYSMEQMDFSISNPYTFAEDVPFEIMRIIKESSSLPGVDIEVVPIREYVDTAIAPHIIGSIGPIYAEDWQELKDKGYTYNDKVGKSGIEKAAESYLKGVDGKIAYTFDGNGKIIDSKVTQQPVPGNTVMLTIDKKLQSIAQTELANLVESLKFSTQNRANAGSVVVVDIKTGDILVSANYPSYDMDEYKTKYQELASNPAKPLFDRAFNGIYPPGSVFKPAVALVGLQLGMISPDEYIKCTRKYTRFEDYQPNCMGRHGNINVITALSKSCNFFFYETGYRIGIDELNSYCRQLGLGVPAGVEIAESSGILAGPEFSKSRGIHWTLGNTIQAAIGQSDNAFTPLQLAMYTATIANGGTRNRAKLISEIRSYSLANVVKSNETEVLNRVEFSDEVIKVVKQGMLSVTEDGTGSATFKNYPIKVGGKTGTAEAPGGDHSVFIAFAPYDDPEIAVSVVIEHGEKGSAGGSLVRKIFDAYFFTQNEQYTEPDANTLLP